MNRVLWICNIMLPFIGQELKLPYSSREGWLSGIFGKMKEKEVPFLLGICFPMGERELIKLKDTGDHLLPQGQVKKLVVQGTVCFAFKEDLSVPERYDTGLEEQFRIIFQDFKPHMIHIFGTEFPHALAAVRTFGNPAGTLLGIQGLCGEIAKVYMAGLPEQVQKKVTFRDFIRKDTIRQQQEKFMIRGKREAEVIAGCGNITGRTVFDRKGTEKINPRAKYFPMDETMRKEFYAGEWRMEACEPYSIFLGQGDYPLKGMHFVLKAMALLLPKYPSLHLYVAGNSVIENSTWKEKIKLPAYGKYMLKLIEEKGLFGKVIMLGKLDGEEMKRQFLKSSLYVCPSVLENSPNTVGEAMLLGVPVAASRTGGIPDMIEDGVDGLLFPAGDERRLAEAIEALWDRNQDKDGLCLAQRISGRARQRAGRVHDGEKNYERLMEIYSVILDETK